MQTTTKPHTGRVALVTGAASGIGRAVALGLAERGATVIVAGHGDLTVTTELIEHAGGAAVAVALDISDTASIESVRAQVAGEHGRVDILVNNAGIFEQATWDQLDLELWDSPARSRQRLETTASPSTPSCPRSRAPP